MAFKRFARLASACLPVLLILALPGCASRPLPPPARPFVFGTDTFAYANELTWEYGFNEKGQWVSTRRDPPPDYSLRCFVVARAARQFFDHARFDPDLPRTNVTGYHQAVREVISRSTVHPSPGDKKVVIPGFANLHAFSSEYEKLLKNECGPAIQSYFQRGHWRMVFPVSRKHQETVAEDMWSFLEQGRPPILHIFQFPSLGINHAILIYQANRFPDRIEFLSYDPNQPGEPALLTFDFAKRSFYLPYNKYFPGGYLNGYIVFRNLIQ